MIKISYKKVLGNRIQILDITGCKTFDELPIGYKYTFPRCYLDTSISDSTIIIWDQNKEGHSLSKNTGNSCDYLNLITEVYFDNAIKLIKSCVENYKRWNNFIPDETVYSVSI
jgi:hypothetical protein